MDLSSQDAKHAGGADADQGNAVGRQPRPAEPVWDTIPAELTSIPRWVCWRYELRNGKWTKPPCQPDGSPASVTDGGTWCVFEYAQIAYTTKTFDGVGIVLDGKDGLCGFDFDHCLDKTGRITDPQIAVLVRQLDSYTEISPSGAGLRVFVRAKLPPGGRKAGQIECYEDGRYLTVTGRHLAGRPDTVNYQQEAVDAVHAAVFAERRAKQEQAQARNGASANNNLDDNELLKLARKAENGEKFSGLYDCGDVVGYPSQSEADLALCQMLAFWTNRDAARIDRLSRASRLMRLKWDRAGDDYSARTINKAIEGCTEDYSGHELRVVRDAASEPEVSNDAGVGDHDELGVAQGDILIADKFLAQHRDNVLYCPTRGWLIYDKRRWRRDEREQITALAEKTVRLLYRDAAAARDDKEREGLVKLAGTYSKAERIRAMLTIARTHVAVVQDDLDRDGFLLNCRNGTVDLRDGLLRPHNRAYLISKLINIDYLCDAKCPRFERFMIEIFRGRTELVEYVQRAVGYSFTGDQREQELYFAHGGGANGKGTLINILLEAAGDYGHVAPSEMLLARKFGDAIPTDRADLCGKRFVSVNETGEGRALAEGLVKSITGNDPISARRMRENYFTFMPSHHIWLSSNHKPNVNGTDFAIWRRINLIPFECRFEGDADDKGLLAALRAELPGILSWVVRGAVAWFRDGRLRKPEVVIAATKQYRDEQDVLGDFLRDCCEIGANLEAQFKDIYRAYRTWCEDAGMKPWSGKRLGQRLAESGYPAVHFRGGSVQRGLEVRP